MSLLKTTFAPTQIAIGIALISSVAFYSIAHAIPTDVHVGFETDASRSVVHPNIFPVVSGGFSSKSPESNSSTEYNMDAEVKISPTHPKANTFLSQNFYWGEKDSSSESPLRLSYGRRLVGWSSLDDMWKLGNVEPLNSWDRLRPIEQGLTGIFAYTETRYLDFRFFASDLFLPEMGPNAVIENGQFSAEHPQSVTTVPQTITILNQSSALSYNLALPSISKILFRPSLLFMIETKHDFPLYGKVGYGYLPLNYFPISLQANLSITQNNVPVVIQPRLLYHHVYIGELGYRLNPRASFGVNAIVDQVIEDPVPSDYDMIPISKSFTYSPWLRYEFPRWKILLSQIWSRGGIEPNTGPDIVQLSSHLFYRNATQVSVSYDLDPGSEHHPVLQLKEIHEYSILADWIAADFFYSFKNHMTFYLGGDLIRSELFASPDKGAEFLADMKTIDRIRLGVIYAF